VKYNEYLMGRMRFKGAMASGTAGCNGGLRGHREAGEPDRGRRGQKNVVSATVNDHQSRGEGGSWVEGGARQVADVDDSSQGRWKRKVVFIHHRWQPTTGHTRKGPSKREEKVMPGGKCCFVVKRKRCAKRRGKRKRKKTFIK